MTRRPRRRAFRYKAGRRRSSLLLAGFLLVLALTVGAAIWSLFSAGPTAKGAAPVTVILPRGHGVWALGADLARAGVIRSGPAFALAAEISGAGPRLRAGEYAFNPGASLWRVLQMVRQGHVVRHFVTIPEGVTSRVAADILNRSEVLTGQAPIAPEGALLPETYEVSRGESRRAVVRRMERARDDLLQTLWLRRKPGLPFATPEDAVILASIVERETALQAERPHVASVFINRLRQGMRLGSDPTVIYGLSQGVPLGHGLTRSELQSSSPYNTYRMAGLPPTPIDNPGRASLTAVLQPSLTSDIYFVADGSGGHAFSATLAGHLKNVQRWRLIEQERQSRRAPIG